MKALNQPKRLDLLYGGSENGFKVDTFHKKCDNIEHTLTLVRTEFGKTIGGYSKYKWNEVENDWVHDVKK